MPKPYIAVGASITRQRPAVMLPRFEGGVDFGTMRKLLARVPGQRDLLWLPGAKHWRGITAGYVYRPGELAVKYAKQATTGAYLASESIGETKLDRVLQISAVAAWIRLYFCRNEPWADDVITAIDARSTVTIRPARRST